jgi:hypothetical protein
VSTAGVEPPLAVIARIDNRSPHPARFAIAVDAHTVCTREVPPGRRRVDCACTSPWDAGVGHQVSVAAMEAAGPWSLSHLEVASHHGATRAYDLIVVPAGKGGRRPGVVVVAAVFIALLVLLCLPGPSWRRPVRVVHRTALIGITVFLALVTLAPMVSAFRVLLSPRLFGALALVAGAPRLWTAAAWLRRGDGQVRWRTAAWLAIVFAVVVGAYGAVAVRLLHERYHGNSSGFLQISRTLFDRHPVLGHRAEVRESLVFNPGGGYDGQFMYFAAFDPLLARYRSDPGTYRLFIDAPPYRFGRIGFSWLAVLFTGGRWPYFPAAMAWLVLISLGLTGVGLGALQPVAWPRPLLGALVVFIPGFWQSLQLCLPEPIAASLLVAGVVFVRAGRPRAAGALFAVSLLVRETGAVLAVALAAGAFWQGRRRDAAWLAGLALAPCVAWRFYVGWVLSPDWGLQAYWLDVNNLGLPFAGLAEMWRRVADGAYYPADPTVARAAIWFSALLVGGFALAACAAARLRTAVAVATAVYGAIALSLTFDSIWVHVGNGQRGGFELFLGLALLTATSPNSARAIRGGLWAFWVAAAGYVFLGGFDAEYIRATIMP